MHDAQKQSTQKAFEAFHDSSLIDIIIELRLLPTVILVIAAIQDTMSDM
jgi:hypothetical protein